jgi:hypothetical protein
MAKAANQPVIATDGFVDYRNVSDGQVKFT